MDPGGDSAPDSIEEIVSPLATPPTKRPRSKELLQEARKRCTQLEYLIEYDARQLKERTASFEKFLAESARTEENLQKEYGRAVSSISERYFKENKEALHALYGNVCIGLWKDTVIATARDLETLESLMDQAKEKGLCGRQYYTAWLGHPEDDKDTEQQLALTGAKA